MHEGLLRGHILMNLSKTEIRKKKIIDTAAYIFANKGFTERVTKK